MARPVAAKAGLEWQGWERNGWKDYVIRELSYSTADLVIETDRLRIPQPWQWVSQRLGWHAESPIEAGKVNVLIPGKESPETTAGASPFISLEKIARSFEEIEPWLPLVTIDQLHIDGLPGNRPIRLRNLQLRQNEFTATVMETGSTPRLKGSLRLEEGTYQITLSPLPDTPDLQILGQLDPRGQYPRLNLRLVSSGKSLTLDVVFGKERILPESLKMKAEEWLVPTLLVKDSPVRAGNLRLTLEATYRERTYTGQLKMSGAVRTPEEGDVPVSIELAFSGNGDSVNVRSFQARTDWLDANLSNPIRYSLKDKQFSDDAVGRLTLDLSTQPWFEASGRVSAKIEAKRQDLEAGKLAFDIEGKDLVVGEHPLTALRIKGIFQHPIISVSEAVITLSESSSIQLSGEYTLQTGELTASGNLTLQPEILEPYVGALEVNSPLIAQFSSEGTLESLRHTGKVEPLTIKAPFSQAIELTAEWSGTGRRSIELETILRTRGGDFMETSTVLDAKGTGDGLSIAIPYLKFNTAGAPEMRLEETVNIQFTSPKDGSFPIVSHFVLSGVDQRIEGESSPDRLWLNLTGFPLYRLNSWFQRELPSVTIDSSRSEITQLSPFLAGTFSMRARESDRVDKATHLSLEGSIGENGLSIRSLDLLLEGKSVLSGNLTLPFQFHPPDAASGQRLYTILKDGALEGSLTADLGQGQSLATFNLAALDAFEELQLDLSLKGTLDKPEATVNASLRKLELSKWLTSDKELPSLENLQLLAEVRSKQIQITQLKGRWAHAQLALSGTIPATLSRIPGMTKEARWKDLFQDADLRLHLETLMAEDFSAWLPGFMRPSGEVSADIVLKPGIDLSGTLALRDFGLRPTLYSRNLDGIHVVLNLNGSRLTLQEARAKVGQGPVSLGGYIDLADPANPLYNLSLTGERTPIMRTPELLIHGDLDLSLKRDSVKSPALLSGEIRLRDSIFLMNFDPLAPRTSGGQFPKPPFFRIEQAPFSEWNLQVEIFGEDFLRLQSHYIKTLLSARFNLAGTLGDPILAGNLAFSTGTLDFPGMRTHFSPSEIYIARDQPESIQLDVSTIGQSASHVVSIHAVETVDNPRIQLEATPQLSNSQILQLLATGSVSRSGFSSVGLYLGRSFLFPGSGSGLYDRLSIEIGRDLTESDKNTIDLYYRLTETLRLHGEYDKYDAQNINLEWEVFEK